MEKLEPLPSAKDLYDYRLSDEGGIPLWLPHNQGDVFSNIDLRHITGEDERGHAMLFLHPCTMRKGAILTDRMTVIAVRSKSLKKPVDDPVKWAAEYSVIPLPDFSGAGRDCFEGVLAHIGTIPTGDLDRADRVAVFSDLGRSHMLHRVIYYLTRDAIPTLRLQETTANVQAELQYQGDWTSKASRSQTLKTEDDIRAIEAEFQERLSQPLASGETLRAMLGSADTADSNEAHRILAGLCDSDEPGSTIRPRS